MKYMKKSDKFINAYEWNSELPTKTFVQLGMNKLGQLEDIEEDFGVELITLFKALEQGYVWVREHNTEEKEIVCERIRLNYHNKTLDFVEPREEIGKGRNLCHFGKTWALTKEELL